MSKHKLIGSAIANLPWEERPAGNTAAIWRSARNPIIPRWPGKVPAGAVCREMAIMFDWMPTLAALAGTAPPADRKIDGKDIWPVVCGATNSPHDPFVYYGTDGKASAIRDGKWKLREGALYDLEADLGETNDVATAYPDVVKLLREKLQQTDKMLTREARPVFQPQP